MKLMYLSFMIGLKARLLDLGVATEEQLKAIDKEARKIVDQAAKEAEASPEPDMKEFYTEIYVEGTEPKSIRGREPGESKFF